LRRAILQEVSYRLLLPRWDLGQFSLQWNGACGRQPESPEAARSPIPETFVIVLIEHRLKNLNGDFRTAEVVVQVSHKRIGHEWIPRNDESLPTNEMPERCLAECPGRRYPRQ
jgi:hypothetical protein